MDNEKLDRLNDTPAETDSSLSATPTETAADTSSMRTKLQSIIAVVVAVLIALFTTGGAVAEESKAKEKDGQRNVTKLELAISKDGRAIVDQNGNIVARFVKGTRVQITTKDIKVNSQKMQGCWRCYPVCVIWDGKRCVEWMRTCDWDFDCK